MIATLIAALAFLPAVAIGMALGHLAGRSLEDMAAASLRRDRIYLREQAMREGREQAGAILAEAALARTRSGDQLWELCRSAYILGLKEGLTSATDQLVRNGQIDTGGGGFFLVSQREEAAWENSATYREIVRIAGEMPKHVTNQFR